MKTLKLFLVVLYAVFSVAFPATITTFPIQAKAQIERNGSPVLIVFEEESNSGGKGLNSEATTAELAVRELLIFNNASRLFEPLHVGYNSLIGHTGFDATERATLHSWEIGLANMYDSGAFGNHQVFLLKSGQGASRIMDWEVGATAVYGSNPPVNPWDTLQARLDSAIILVRNMTGQTPQVIFWRSQGINDGIFNTNPDVWEAATIADMAKHRVKYPDAAFVITLLTPAYPELNKRIYNIKNKVRSVAIVNTLDLVLISGDPYHWNSDSQRTLGYRATAATIPFLNYSKKGRKATLQ